uniref:Uncharacterized protein n=1 Tax=Glossina pallidipes TaxID=7398 RepID=A0A1A9ZMX3_GLOPL
MLNLLSHICLKRDTNSYECGCYSPTNSYDANSMSENVECPSTTGTDLKSVTNILRESRVHPKKYSHIQVCKGGGHRTFAALIRMQDGISSGQYLKFYKPITASSSRGAPGTDYHFVLIPSGVELNSKN